MRTNLIDPEQIADAANQVIGFIYNERPRIVEYLFGDATEDHKMEWHGRNTGEFWGHLDSKSQIRLVEFMLVWEPKMSESRNRYAAKATISRELADAFGVTEVTGLLKILPSAEPGGEEI